MFPFKIHGTKFPLFRLACSLNPFLPSAHSLAKLLKQTRPYLDSMNHCHCTFLDWSSGENHFSVQLARFLTLVRPQTALPYLDLGQASE